MHNQSWHLCGRPLLPPSQRLSEPHSQSGFGRCARMRLRISLRSFRQASFSCKPTGSDKSVPLIRHAVHLPPTAQVFQQLPPTAQVCQLPANVISRCPVSGECHRPIFRVLLFGRVSPRNTCKLTCSGLMPTLLQAHQARHRLYRLLCWVLKLTSHLNLPDLLYMHIGSLHDTKLWQDSIKTCGPPMNIF